MLFGLSFLLFIVYAAIVIKNKDRRWIGWVLAAVYFGVIVLFGDLLKSVFNLEEGSKTFFMFLAVIFALIPVILGEVVGMFFGKKTA